MVRSSYASEVLAVERLSAGLVRESSQSLKILVRFAPRHYMYWQKDGTMAQIQEHREVQEVDIAYSYAYSYRPWE